MLNNYLIDFINMSSCNMPNISNASANICRYHLVGAQDGYANIPCHKRHAVDINNNKPSVIHDTLASYKLRETDLADALPNFDQLFNHEVNESASKAADNTHDQYTSLLNDIKANVSAIDDDTIQSES